MREPVVPAMAAQPEWAARAEPRAWVVRVAVPLLRIAMMDSTAPSIRAMRECVSTSWDRTAARRHVLRASFVKLIKVASTSRSAPMMRFAFRSSAAILASRISTAIWQPRYASFRRSTRIKMANRPSFAVERIAMTAWPRRTPEPWKSATEKITTAMECPTKTRHVRVCPYVRQARVHVRPPIHAGWIASTK